jgi:hypothetical protein
MKKFLVLVALLVAAPVEAGSITLTPAHLQALITGLVVGRVYTFTLSGCVQRQTCKQHETTTTVTDETDQDTDTEVREQDARPAQEGHSQHGQPPSVVATDGVSPFRIVSHTQHTATSTTLFIAVESWLWNCDLIIIEWDDCPDCTPTPQCEDCPPVVVPEPWTILLLSVGLAGVGLFGLRMATPGREAPYIPKGDQ